MGSLPSPWASDQVSQLQPVTPAVLLTPIDGPSEGSSREDCYTHHSLSEGSTRQIQSRLTIDKLPDEVLLAIFIFYTHKDTRENLWEMLEARPRADWERLVHVCRQWRYVVFGSLRRLDLRLLCTPGTPVRERLDIWPALPIVVWLSDLRLKDENKDNLAVALEQNDRIREIYIEIRWDWAIGTLAELMGCSFPALTHLKLERLERQSVRERTFIVPDSFLGGSAPSLQSLYLFNNIAFPTLPKLLLSATGLVHLWLWDVPRPGYIFPEVMAKCLSSLTRLETLRIGFAFDQPSLDRASQHPPVRTRVVLPVLTSLTYGGENEYLYCLFDHLDTPLLEFVNIKFSNSAIFDTSTISPFIGPTEMFEAFDHAHMLFHDNLLRISLSSQVETAGGQTLWLTSSIICRDSVWQLKTLDTFGRYDFKLEKYFSPPWWGEAMKNAQWLQLLRLFPAVKNLYISEQVTPWLAATFEELDGGQVPELLPALQNLFVERLVPPVDEAIGKFVAVRQLSGHPIAVQCWSEKTTV